MSCGCFGGCLLGDNCLSPIAATIWCSPSSCLASWTKPARFSPRTGVRIAFLRHLIALLESQPDTPFLGQVKTLLTGPELPVASDVAVPWDHAYFIEFLKPKLGEHHAEFLTALIAVMNDLAKMVELEQFPDWKTQLSLPLEMPGPD